LIAAHLEWCTDCRAEVAKAEAVGGHLLATQTEQEMSTTALTKIWNSIDNTPRVKQLKRELPTKHGLPSVLSTLFPAGLQNIKWRKLSPGIKQHKLSQIDSGAGTIRLLQIEQGISIPDHTHVGTELTFILQGSYTDETGHYRHGDLSDADDSLRHSPTVDSEQPCICLIATDERLLFSNRFNKIIQPFIGI
jgi:putative transcriptional regulator